MKKFADWVVLNPLLIVIIGMVLFVPAIIGYMNTRINYDILVYLPDNIDTIKGEKILTDDFGLGSYAFVMIDTKNPKKVLRLEDEVRKISGVSKVFSIQDVISTTIPKEMLPKEVLSKLYNKDTSIMMVTFKDSTSSDSTINAVRELRKVVGDASKVSSMTSLVLDTMDLSNEEVVFYVVVAIIFCFVVLTVATDSYVIPFLLLLNIGIAIIYNLGTNIFLGQISYITKAIVAILQLGVTTDFSIFLYHKYEQAKENKKIKNNRDAMSFAICETLQSVVGSSLTTFVGFLALCTMDLTLGTDIGLVMSKGVVFGLVCVLTIFPALILLFDKYIEKTHHRRFLPEFRLIQKFSLNHYIFLFICFLLLMIPAYIGNSNYDVYYKLDEALPEDLAFHVADSELADKFGIKAAEIAIIDKNINRDTIIKLVDDIKKVDGVDFVLAPSTVVDEYELLPDDLKDILDHDKYQLLILNSNYEIASDELNQQVIEVEKIVKKYDKNGILAGEGALMKDLVTIADHDFHMVNYTSIIVIFFVMLIILKSIGLPIVLIIAIEFAIFMNMACAYFTGTRLPFIASIVVGTIQLGATIDYAILMSTTYLGERHNKGKNRKKAMEDTLKLTVPSIITSALCFFAATIGVSLYTRIDMIGSICTLLSRGAIISMMVVIFILPSLLMIFDSFIMKTTYFKKEGK